ncbi:MAG: hypothetical protein KIT16_20680 [Rhodospirillaceae bacterium]|nr:hypothetical protein [Rhodospirillaceae bacterium]
MTKLAAALAAIAVLGVAAPALAQGNPVRDLLRKARAGEADAGFCRSVAGRLPALTDPQLRGRIGTLLSNAPDREERNLVFAMREVPNGGPMLICLYFEFGPAAVQNGKKCRPTRIYACVDGRECSAKTDDSICEQKPGEWD